MTIAMQCMEFQVGHAVVLVLSMQYLCCACSRACEVHVVLFKVWLQVVVATVYSVCVRLCVLFGDDVRSWVFLFSC